MGVIAGAIAGVIGIGGAFGEAIVEIGLAVGLSWAAKKIAPKPKTGSTRGQSLNLQIATNPYRKVPIGKVGTAGDLTYWQLSGDNNDVLEMVVALGDLPCDSLDHSSVFIDGKQHTIDDNGHPDGASPGIATKLTFIFRNGDPGQSVPTNLKNDSDGRWTDTEVGNNVCYVVVRAIYDDKTFPSGIPQVVFTLNGAKLYDWRKDSTNGGSGSHRWADPSTWEFSDNPIVALYSVLRGIAPGGVPLIGMGVPAAALRLSDFTAAANACDETVALGAGGTEKRYRLSAVFDTSMTNRDIIETILASCAGELIESCGIYRPMVGVAQSSVASITDADLIVTQPFQSDAKRPRTELFNAVYGSYSDPNNGFNEAPLPNRTSSDDEAEDGGLRLPQTLDLACVTSRTQAQRIMEIARKRARRQLIVSCTLRARWFTLEPGDWITFNSDRRGYTDRVFEIQTIKVNSDLTSDVTMREVDAGIDDWSTSDELADDTATDLASGGPGFSTITGLEITTVTLEGDGGLQYPALAFQWDAVTDATVLSLNVEYRKSGDTAAISDTILEPSTGGVWLATKGIQGGVTYEGRLMPVTAPTRATEWTSWVTATAATDPQVVSTALIAVDGTPPNTITPEMLDAQTRFKIGLVAAVDTVLGSVSNRDKEVSDRLKSASEAAIRALMAGDNNSTDIRLERTQRLTDREAFAQQILTIQAQLNVDVAAQFNQIIQAYTSADSALASDIATVSTALYGNIATVTVLSESVDGVLSSLTFALNENGAVVGLIDFAQENGVSALNFDIGSLLVSLNNVDGGDPVPVFGIAMVNDSPKIALRGDMVADGSITVQKLNAASIATLYISDPDNTYFYNFAAGQQGATDGTFLIDMKADSPTRGIDIAF